MLSIEQTREIEILALKGQAVGSLLGTASSLEECSTKDIGLSVYALECYFTDILTILEGGNSGQNLQ